jgi:hypothetical protein
MAGHESVAIDSGAKPRQFKPEFTGTTPPMV